MTTETQELTQETVNLIMQLTQFEIAKNDYFQAIDETPSVAEQRRLNRELHEARSDLNFSYQEYKE